MTELKEMVEEKIKQELIKKILNKYSYKVIETDRNRDIEDFKGFHYKISITNKETKKYRSFNFSVGYGWNSEQRADLNLFLNLLYSLNSDRFYTDKEELKRIFLNLLYSLNSDGFYTDKEELKRIYEDEKLINKIHKAVLKNYDKMQTIGLNIFFDELNETEQEILNEGF